MTEATGVSFNRVPLEPLLVDAEVIAYWNAHCSTQACPMCAGRAFTIPWMGVAKDAFTAYGVYRMEANGAVGSAPVIVPVVLSVCDSCGWIAAFSRTMVEEWVARRRANDPGAAAPAVVTAVSLEQSSIATATGSSHA